MSLEDPGYLSPMSTRKGSIATVDEDYLIRVNLRPYSRDGCSIHRRPCFRQMVKRKAPVAKLGAGFVERSLWTLVWSTRVLSSLSSGHDARE